MALLKSGSGVSIGGQGGQKESFDLKFAKFMMGPKQRLRFYRKLSGLLKNGVALQQALDVLWNRASDNGRRRKDPMAVAIDQWRKVVRNGRRFGEALDGWAPDAECLIIDAGELAGRLDGALLDAITLNKGTTRMKGAILGGVSYPIVITAVIIGVLYLFATQIIPAFDEVASKDRWTGMARGLAIMSDLARDYTIPAIVVLVILVVLCIVSLPRWTGRARSMMDRYPPYSLYRTLVGTSFMLSLGGLLKAGVQIPNALKKLNRSSSPWLKERIDGGLRGVLGGLNLGEALQRSGHEFPDRELVDDMRVYAELANFDDFMDSVGRDWLEEAILNIENQAKVMYNVLLFVLGLFVAWITYGLMMVQAQVAELAQLPQ